MRLDQKAKRLQALAGDPYLNDDEFRVFAEALALAGRDGVCRATADEIGRRSGRKSPELVGYLVARLATRGVVRETGEGIDFNQGGAWS